MVKLLSLPQTETNYIITAKRFPHSGFSGSWDKSTTLDFGVTDNPPEVDMQRGITTNTIKSVYLSENKYVEVELPAGRYWLFIWPWRRYCDLQLRGGRGERPQAGLAVIHRGLDSLKFPKN